MKRQEDARFKKTRKALHKAFFQLATTRSVGEIMVKELTETAQINRTTFYLHYRSTNDIYTDIVSEIETYATGCIAKYSENLIELNFSNFAEAFVKCWDDMFAYNEVDFTKEIFQGIKIKAETMMCNHIYELLKNSKVNYTVSNEVLNSIILSFISLILEWVVSKRKTSITKLCRELKGVIANGIVKN